MKSRKYFLKKTLTVCFNFGIFWLMVSQSFGCFAVFLLITSSCNKLFSFVVFVTCSCSELCSFVVLIACSCPELNDFCLFGQPFTTTSTAQSSWAMYWPAPPHADCQLRTTRGDANSPKVNVMWVAVYKALHYNRPLSFISLLHSDNPSESATKFYNSFKADVGGNVLTLT